MPESIQRLENAQDPASLPGRQIARQKVWLGAVVSQDTKGRSLERREQLFGWDRGVAIAYPTRPDDANTTFTVTYRKAREPRHEAIAALLGHRSLRMTLVYARIADRTVADEYFKVSEKVEALYDQPKQLPSQDEGSEMAKLRREMNRRMLGNGYCARPIELDCQWVAHIFFRRRSGF
jgi:hypothetical protein